MKVYALLTLHEVSQPSYLARIGLRLFPCRLVGELVLASAILLQPLLLQLPLLRTDLMKSFGMMCIDIWTRPRARRRSIINLHLCINDNRWRCKVLVMLSDGLVFCFDSGAPFCCIVISRYVHALDLDTSPRLSYIIYTIATNFLLSEITAPTRLYSTFLFHNHTLLCATVIS